MVADRGNQQGAVTGPRLVHAMIAALLAAAACSSPASSDPAPAEKPTPVEREKKAQDAAAKLVGIKPPEWTAERWINSKPRTLASLRGNVVLVRWWTAGCPFCSASAPALREFHKTYGPKGLTVIGMYHHKEDGPFDPAVYESTAKKYGFTFPLAFDPEWKTFDSWMHDAGGKEVSTGFTSVSFLIDKKGVIRHVHPGGQYVAGDPGYDALQRKITELLAER